MEIHTIGFTKWRAREFFGRLRSAGIEQLLDVRLNNTSQLSGFAKRDDLAYFVTELVGAEYAHMPDLAPSAEMLKAYRSGDWSWAEYEAAFLELLDQRSVAVRVPPETFTVPTVLLCSEHEPDRCHRRLVVEHLAKHWGGVEAVHL